MRKFLFLVALTIGVGLGLAGRGQAQATAWVQIEAQPNLPQAQDRARAYAGVLPDVAGFAMRTGWYAIVLGPYDPAVAANTLSQLRSTGQIPRDSFVSDGSSFMRQFWPLDAAASGGTATDQMAGQTAGTQDSGGQTSGALAPDVETSTLGSPAANDTATTTTEPAPAAAPEETPSEARRSEAQLTRDQRMQLQTALQWQGFYDSAIDGAFGAGTRSAMAAWQSARGYDPTGILTTRQRATLIEAWQKERAALGLQQVRDEQAGIEITLPMALIGPARYDPPFVHFDEKDGSGVQVLLISEQGNAAALAGLYNIMQTLAIVPMQGERDLGQNAFTLTGQNDRIHSYTHAELSDGLIKGYTLVWKPGDDTRMGRVLDAMKASFKGYGGHALDSGLAPTPAVQRRDLLSGLAVRQPKVARSGFFVDASGTVLTTTDVLRDCTRITVGDGHEARIAWRDNALGLAVLKPADALAPLAYAHMTSAAPRLDGEVAVAGFSYGGVLASPALTYGTLSDLTGLNGEAGLRRLSLKALPGDAGGPVFDASGAVLGMLLPRKKNSARQLPKDVQFAAAAPAIETALAQAGVTADEAQPTPGVMAPDDLSKLGADMTVLVSCWK